MALCFMRYNRFSLKRESARGGGRGEKGQVLHNNYLNMYLTFKDLWSNKDNLTITALVKWGILITPLFFDMPKTSYFYTNRASSVLLKTLGTEKLQCTVALAMIADNRLPFVVFQWKIQSKDKLLNRITLWVHIKRWCHLNEWNNGSRLCKAESQELTEQLFLSFWQFPHHVIENVKTKMKRSNTV